MPKHQSIRWFLSIILLSTLLLVGFGKTQVAVVEAAGPTFTVNSVADTPDLNIGDGICAAGSIVVNGQTVNECTFRAAVQETNAVLNDGNTILFDIREPDGSCPISAKRIDTVAAYWYGAPNPVHYVFGNKDHFAAYPILDKNVTIDGFSQCGAQPNSSAVGDNAKIRIELYGNGSNSETKIGIGIFQPSETTTNVTIRGLSFKNWGRAIDLYRANGNTIAGNYIGLSPTGSGSSSNQIGIHLYYAQRTVIGGINLADRNIVSANKGDGVGLREGVRHTQFIGNYVGIKPDGKTASGNGSDAVDIQNGASYNWIGGVLLQNDTLFPVLDANGDAANAILDENGRVIADPRKRNIFAGGADDAIELTHPVNTSYNHIVGNWMGLDAFGSALGNNNDGINVEDDVRHTKIYQNIIVNNAENGIHIWTSHYTEVYDNWIGVRPAGLQRADGVVISAEETAMGNGTNGTATNTGGRDGIRLMGGSTYTIIARNVIANNPSYGIHLRAEATYTALKGYGTCFNDYNTFSQNSIYDNNNFNGIRLQHNECDADGDTNNATADWVPALQNKGIGKPVIDNTSNTSVVTGYARGYHQVAGTAYPHSFPNDNSTLCVGCTVEVFIADTTYPDGSTAAGQGKTYIGSATTGENSRFVLFISGVPAGSHLTATVTDPAGNTSIFANNVQVNAPSNSCAPAVAPNVTAAQNGNNVVLNWTHNNANIGYQIYRSTNADFTPSSETLHATVVAPNNSYTDTGAMNGTTSYYYLVKGVNNCGASSADGNRFGSVKIALTPGWNMVSWPVIPVNGTSLEAVIGDQLYGTGSSSSADVVTVWNTATSQYVSAWFCSGACVSWGEPWANHWLSGDYSQSTITLPAGTGFWVQNRTGSTEYIVVLGTVPTADVQINVAADWNLLGNAFPQARTLDQLNLPHTGTANPLTSNELLYWDAATQSYQTAWFCACPEWGDKNNKWLNVETPFEVATITIQPGTAFWYNNRAGNAFTWSNLVNP